MILACGAQEEITSRCYVLFIFMTCIALSHIFPWCVECTCCSSVYFTLEFVAIGACSLVVYGQPMGTVGVVRAAM